MSTDNNNNNITPRQAIKLAETSPKFTPKEREKTLALGVYFLVASEPENFPAQKAMICKTLWEFSQYVSSYYGYSIPPFNPKLMVDIVNNPARYADYR